jgi:hypothetical protein
MALVNKEHASDKEIEEAIKTQDSQSQKELFQKVGKLVYLSLGSLKY